MRNRFYGTFISLILLGSLIPLQVYAYGYQYMKENSKRMDERAEQYL